MSYPTQTFGVLCVTKRQRHPEERPRHQGRDVIWWHIPISGIARVDAPCKIEVGLQEEQLGDATVSFLGMDCKLLYVRSGIGGSSLTLGISVDYKGVSFDLWELYTSTPARDGVDVQDVVLRALRTASDKSRLQPSMYALRGMV